MAIGHRLDEIRQAKGVSQAELARRAQISPQTLNKILKGRIKDPSFTMVARIGRALGVPLTMVAALEFAWIRGEVRRNREGMPGQIDYGTLKDELSRLDRVVSDARSVGLNESISIPSPLFEILIGETRHEPDQIADRASGSPAAEPPPPFEIVDYRAGMVEVQVKGEVAAGLPMDNPISGDTVLVPEEFAPREGEVLLRARGDSMIEFGIEDGDYVVVEPREGGVAASGEIVIGWLNDGLTVKRWFRKGGRKILQGSTEQTTFELGPDDTFDLRAVVRRSFKVRHHPKISG